LGPAELLRESEEAGGREFLIAQNQHLGGEECVPDLPEIRADVVRFRAKCAELSQLHPRVARSCFIRAHARGGSDNRPAASAKRKSSLKCRMFRADSWPPTMTKWSWWPFSQAMNTTPVL